MFSDSLKLAFGVGDMAMRRDDVKAQTLEQRVARIERMITMGQGAFKVLLWIGGIVTFVLTTWTLIATALHNSGPPPPSP